MEDFVSESDSEFSSYWRDWVGSKHRFLFPYMLLSFLQYPPDQARCRWSLCGLAMLEHEHEK